MKALQEAVDRARANGGTELLFDMETVEHALRQYGNEVGMLTAFRHAIGGVGTAAGVWRSLDGIHNQLQADLRSLEILEETGMRLIALYEGFERLQALLPADDALVIRIKEVTSNV